MLTGTLDGSLTVNSGGALGLANSPSSLSVAGHFTENSGGTLSLDLAGSTGAQFDHLSITGAVSLSGSLLLTGGFTPTTATVFPILSAYSITGAFAGLPNNAIVSFNGRRLRINYTATAVTLTDIGSPPTTAANNAAVSANEGSNATNTGTFNDPDGDSTDVLTASVGAVTQNNATGTWNWSLPTTDGPAGPFTVTITATDNFGTQASTSFTYTVSNVPPTVTAAAAQTAIAGASTQFTMGSFSDPGIFDAPWTASVNWGDNTSPTTFTTTSEGALASKTHTYFAAGPYSVTVSVTDKDGGVGSNSFQVTVLKASPLLSSTAGGAVVVGSSSKLTDSATLSGGANETGTLTFTLYSPSNTVVDTETATVSGNGTYSTPTGYLPTAAGTYQWVASYGGDSNNNGVNSAFGSEPETVSAASPSLNTTAGGAVVVGSGGKLTDAATVAGGYNATGTITFTLYSPSNTVVDTETATVSGNGTYTTPTGYLPMAAGTYQWVASYAGDSNNNAVSSAVGSEPETATPASPTLVTTPTPTAVTLGTTATTLADSATLAGGYNPAGVITFTLYAPDGATVVDTETAAVSGNGTYSTPSGCTLPTTGAAAGADYWNVSYSGDNNNNPVLPVGPNVVTLASFGATGGEYPYGGLIEDQSGNLFGTTEIGGWIAGTVFELPAGSGPITTLATFYGINGAYPFDNLIEDQSGNLFGTTYGGGTIGQGAVFELPAGTSSMNLLASFTGGNGRLPWGSLVEDRNGNLFGTTSEGGAYDDGAVFELPAGSGTTTTLATFNDANGADPLGGLVEDQSGNFFGTTTQGGAYGYGTVFEVAAGSGAITTLASFNDGNGAVPRAGLVEDQYGNLFGATSQGGANGYGTVFEVAAGSSAITTLAAFNNQNGANPYDALIEDQSGNLFGATNAGGPYGFGTVFEVSAGSGAITTLASFNNANGANPTASLVEDHNGNLFGTTLAGGASGYGTVFEVAASQKQVTVNQANPTLTATPSQTAVTLGTMAPILTDTAGLAGGYYPTGTLTFTLYHSGDLVDTETVAVTGNGNYSTPAGYTLPPTGIVTGGYQWDVSYSGDGNNNASSDNNATAEQVTITPAASTIATTAGGAVIIRSGADLTDSATLAGGYHPTGVVTFTLYAPDSVTVVDTETAAVSANGTYSTPTGYLPTATGTYQWVASYGGDSNNNGVGSTFGIEPETVNAASTTTTVTSSLDSSRYGQAVSFTVFVGVNAPAMGTATGRRAICHRRQQLRARFRLQPRTGRPAPPFPTSRRCRPERTRSQPRTLGTATTFRAVAVCPAGRSLPRHR